VLDRSAHCTWIGEQNRVPGIGTTIPGAQRIPKERKDGGMTFFELDFSSEALNLGAVGQFLLFMIVATLLVAAISMVTRYRA
jgi:hypothetical protein